MVTEVEVKAPGKAILHGEHTVVYGTKAIGIAVGLYTQVRVLKFDSTNVRVLFDEVGLSQLLPIEELKKLKSSLGEFNFEILDNSNGIDIDEKVSLLLEDYVKMKNGFTGNLRTAFEATFKAFLFIYLAAFDNLEPIDVSVNTELPVGAGLGSSASFAVALAGGLLAAAGRTSHTHTQINSDMVNRWAFVSERFVHGNPSGIDNTVATLGGAVLYQKNHPLVPFSCPNIKVLLVSTEVPRSTKELVSRVAALKQENPDLHGEYMDEVNSLVAKAFAELKTNGVINPNLVEQNQMVLQKLNVSHPRLDIIVETAKLNGLRAKLTGAGGGGCAFVVIPPECSKETLQKLELDLKAQCEEFKFWSVPLGVSGICVTQLS